MYAEAKFRALRASDEMADLEDLEVLYDALPAITTAFMLGEWDGGLFRTGHPAEAQLPALNWAGKTFRCADDVDPIVSLDEDGRRFANPAMGGATLRAVEYRGVVTATMVYDSHPVFDHFRKLNDDTVLGVMDRKGDDMPLYFYLTRR